MRLVVLNVAFPFARVGPGATGVAEQVLTQLDAALLRAGHESIVMACEESSAEGILLATATPPGPLDDAARHRACEQYRFLLEKFLEKWPIDVIHFHGADFYEYLPPPGVPVLVTLHQPPAAYPPEIFNLQRPQTYLQCISESQHAACPPCAGLLPPIEAGVEPYFAVYERLAGEAREQKQISETVGTVHAAAVEVVHEPIFPIPEFARAAT